MIIPMLSLILFFFFNDTATTEIYTLSLHDALPISIGDERCDLGPALEARIDETLNLKPRQRRPIVLEMLALAAHRLLPRDAEPSEILVDRGLIFGTAAGVVDVLDAQQQAPT